MNYRKEDCQEAHRQIASTVHKLRETLHTLETKPDPSRYKSQITLAQRRIAAFELALALIEEKLDDSAGEP